MKILMGLLLALGASLMTACQTMSEHSVRPESYSGVRLYQVYCSSCHGLTGHGDGPVQPLLKVGVPDLTRISERNGGKFPEDEIYRIIDGQSERQAHGTRRMPVWGYEFYGSSSSDRAAHAAADRAVQKLVDHLWSLQPENRK